VTIRFFLVRHARAEAHHPQGDAARRLLPEGRAAFAAHARALARDLPLARIATSPFARAVETAELLSGATGAAVEEDAALGSGESDGRGLLRHGRLLGDRSALVGHNPEIREAIALAAGKALDVPPGTVAAVDEDAGEFRLAWLRAP
jgi:phosphohistidine phosphatase